MTGTLRIAFSCFQSVRRQIIERGRIRLPSLEDRTSYMLYMLLAREMGALYVDFKGKLGLSFYCHLRLNFCMCFSIFHLTILESHRFVCYSYGCYSVIPTAGFQSSRSESQFVHASHLTSVQSPNFNRQTS